MTAHRKSRSARPRGLTRWFERVCVITLARRPDRLAKLKAHMEQTGLGSGVSVVDAVDGAALTPPDGWDAGHGAWGCLQSHLAVLKAAQADRVTSVLVLEDDVIFSPYTAAWLPRLMRDLPQTWGQLYLGGQHLETPLEAVTPLLWRAANINRTHAYAVSRAALPVIIAHLERIGDYLHRGWHVDHQLGAGQSAGLWETFAPSWWLAGQSESTSDISAAAAPERWWHHPRYAAQMPLVIVPARQRLAPEDLATLCFDHDAVRVRIAAESAVSFFQWAMEHAAASLVTGQLPAIREPLPPALHRYWAAGILTWPLQVQGHPRDYPGNGLFPHPFAGPAAGPSS